MNNLDISLQFVDLRLFSALDFLSDGRSLRHGFCVALRDQLSFLLKQFTIRLARILCDFLGTLFGHALSISSFGLRALPAENTQPVDLTLPLTLSRVGGRRTLVKVLSNRPRPNLQVLGVRDRHEDHDRLALFQHRRTGHIKLGRAGFDLLAVDRLKLSQPVQKVSIRNIAGSFALLHELLSFSSSAEDVFERGLSFDQ